MLLEDEISAAFGRAVIVIEHYPRTCTLDRCTGHVTSDEMNAVHDAIVEEHERARRAKAS